jgi:hypothetical protein
MRREQRIFHRRRVFTIFAFAAMLPGAGTGSAAERVLIADGKISIELADGWAETDLNPGKVLAGFATQDKKNSLFLTGFQSGGSLLELMDQTITNFGQTFEITSEEKAKTGQVNGPGDKKWPAVFKSLEADVKNGNGTFPMKFHLLVFDTGSQLYTFQASSLKPVREARERQIFEMIRSLVAKP